MSIGATIKGLLFKKPTGGDQRRNTQPLVGYYCPTPENVKLHQC